MTTEVRAAVLVGGIVGTLLRLLVVAVVPPDTFPLGTLLANLLGAFALAVLAGWLPDADPRLRALVGTGVLGSFTTFSAITVDVVALGARPLASATYVVLTLAGGLVVARLGRQFGEQRARAVVS